MRVPAPADCAHSNIERGDEFTPDSCRDCFVAVYPLRFQEPARDADVTADMLVQLETAAAILDNIDPRGTGFHPEVGRIRAALPALVTAAKKQDALGAQCEQLRREVTDWRLAAIKLRGDERPENEIEEICVNENVRPMTATQIATAMRGVWQTGARRKDREIERLSNEVERLTAELERKS